MAVASTPAPPLPQCAESATAPKTGANGAAPKNGHVYHVVATAADEASAPRPYALRDAGTTDATVLYVPFPENVSRRSGARLISCQPRLMREGSHSCGHMPVS